MYPILARYGPFFLYSFTVVLGLGIAASVGLTAWLERREPGKRTAWLDASIVALVAGVIAGRIGFVWANWSYFQERPGEIGLIWRGGLSYHGALLAGLLALWAWSAWRGYSAGNYFGLLAPALALGSAFGWLACWFEGCAFGRETLLSLLAADLPDTYGVFSLRYQTQMLGLGLALLAFLLILWMRSRVRPGILFWIALLTLSGGRAIVSLFRGDAVPLVGQVRLDTVLELVTVVMCLLAISVSLARRQNVTKSN